MKKITLLIFPLICNYASCQSIPDSLNPLQKNQISFQMNWLDESDGPWFSVEYSRLRNAKYYRTDNNLILLKKLRMGIYFSDLSSKKYNPWRVSLTDQYLIGIADSIITQRSSGKSSNDYNFQFGIENQFRNLFNSKRFTGIQFFYSYYGLLGYTRVIEQYTHTEQEINSIQSQSTNISVLNPPLVLGERYSRYFRFGFGIRIGFDIVILAMNQSNISLGMNFDSLNFGAAFLANTNTNIDLDDVYKNDPKKFFFHNDRALNFRVSLEF